jgi:hypothetical protein
VTLPAARVNAPRPQVINSTVSIESRIVKFFEMVEADLYGKLQSEWCDVTWSDVARCSTQARS